MVHEYGESLRYIESVVRTNKLYCSKCYRDIKKGEDVIFALEESGKGELKMVDVYCDKCNTEFTSYVIDDEQHPLDLD